MVDGAVAASPRRATRLIASRCQWRCSTMELVPCNFAFLGHSCEQPWDWFAPTALASSGKAARSAGVELAAAVALSQSTWRTTSTLDLGRMFKKQTLRGMPVHYSEDALRRGGML